MSKNKEEVIVTANEGYSYDVFPNILDLHLPEGASIADVTYGKGTFWKKLDESQFDLKASDIDEDKSPVGESIDFRDLPYSAESFDCVVLDPPHIEGYYRRNVDQLPGAGSHSKFREAYSNGEAYSGSARYHNAVLETYFEAGREAHRVLKDGGILIAKIVDEVCSNRQELTHIQVTNFYQKELGFYPKDLFIQMRPNTPSTNGIDSQVHARKNHSYYIVYEKTDTHRTG